MSRPVCTVCTHPKRAAIDAALVAGQADRPIATLYGVSRSAVRRHEANHLGAVTKAVEARAASLVVRSEAQHAEGVVELLLAGYRRATDLENQARRLASVAEDEGKIGTAIMGVGEARQALGEQRQHLTVVGKATGEIGPDTAVTIDMGGERATGTGAERDRILRAVGAGIRDAPADMTMGEWRERVLPGLLREGGGG